MPRKGIDNIGSGEGNPGSLGQAYSIRFFSYNHILERASTADTAQRDGVLSQRDVSKSPRTGKALECSEGLNR